MSRDKEIRKDLDRHWEEFLEIMKEFARQNILIDRSKHRKQ